MNKMTKDQGVATTSVNKINIVKQQSGSKIPLAQRDMPVLLLLFFICSFLVTNSENTCS